MKVRKIKIEASDGKDYEVIDSLQAAEMLGLELSHFHKNLSSGEYNFSDIKIKIYRFFVKDEVKAELKRIKKQKKDKVEKVKNSSTIENT